MKGYEFDISKLAENSIIMKGQINDVVFGLKEISDKIDTLIALKQVELLLNSKTATGHKKNAGNRPGAL